MDLFWTDGAVALLISRRRDVEAHEIRVIIVVMNTHSVIIEEHGGVT